ncbi:unnamed protein product [Durusdinium trenchii]
MEEKEEDCTGGYETTGNVLGEGTYGTVYEVEKKIEKKWYKRRQRQQGFAVKVPESDGIKDLQKEIAVLDEVGTCDGVMPMVEKSPCVDDEKLPNSFVTKRYAGDLYKWARRFKPRARARCYRKVYNQVVAGLQCMWDRGWIHNDVKAGNIFYERIGQDGCPEGVVLADFGLSRQIGHSIRPFDEEDYMSAYYVVESLFYGMEDPLKIRKSFEKKNGGGSVVRAAADKKIDLCSFAYMIDSIWGKAERTLQKILGPGPCGPMGSGRRKLYP